MANGRASGLGVQMISRVNVLSMLRRQGPCQCAKRSLTSRAGASRREFHATWGATRHRLRCIAERGVQVPQRLSACVRVMAPTMCLVTGACVTRSVSLFAWAETKPRRRRDARAPQGRDVEAVKGTAAETGHAKRRQMTSARATV